MWLNETLGIQYPLIQGGMARVATGEFAAAVSNAGGADQVQQEAQTKTFRDEFNGEHASSLQPFLRTGRKSRPPERTSQERSQTASTVGF